MKRIGRPRRNVKLPAQMGGNEIPIDMLPIMTWPKFTYDKQDEFIRSKSRETWFIAGNGTGKTLIFYLDKILYMLGWHPNQIAPPPIKVRILVPSFDNVEDVALEKLMQPQKIVFNPDTISEKQKAWIDFMLQYDCLLDCNMKKGIIEIGQLLPKRLILSKKDFKKDHKGIELTNWSSIWWATGEQGWQAQRGGEQDVLGMDEEGPERVWDELKRGLRNAKGGGKVNGAFTPPYEPGCGPTWTKEKIVDAAVEDPDIHVINACMADNPAITKDYIAWFSKGKTQKQIDVQIYGKHPIWGDLVHKEFQNRLWNPKEIDGHLLPNDHPMPENHEVDWVMAFDWHPSKACAAAFGYIDGDGNPVFFDELDKDVAEGREIGELAEIFKSIEGQPHDRRKFRRWQDPSAKSKYQAVQRGFNAWDAFRKEGIITSAGRNRDPLVGIDIVNQYLRGNGKDHPRMFIFERCKWLRHYMTNHYWIRGADGVGKPDPKWGDYPICVRYILQEIGWRTTEKTKRGSKWPLTSYGDVERFRRSDWRGEVRP